MKSRSFIQAMAIDALANNAAALVGFAGVLDVLRKSTSKLIYTMRRSSKYFRCAHPMGKPTPMSRQQISAALKRLPESVRPG